MLGAGVSLEIELVSVLVHAVLFFTVLAVFSRLVVGPLSRIHDSRREATSGLQDKVDALAAEVESIEANYHERIARARAEAMESRESLRAEGVNAATAIMDTVRTETAEKLQQAKGELDGVVNAARQELTGETAARATMIAQRIVGSQISGDCDGAPTTGGGAPAARAVGKA